MRRTLALAVCAVAILATACAGEPNEVTTEGDSEVTSSELPNWLLDVQPAPGVSMASVSVVEVRHRVRGGDESVRLTIDGVDVTSRARVSPGRLHYNPVRPGPVAPLDPGRHTAVVERTKRPDFGSRPEIIDTFRWTFTIR